MLPLDYEHYIKNYENTFKYIVEDVKHYGSFKKSLLANNSKIPACLISDYQKLGNANELFENLDMSQIALETAEFIGGNTMFNQSLSFRDKFSRLIFKTHKETIEDMYEQAECYICAQKHNKINRALNKADDDYEIARAAHDSKVLREMFKNEGRHI